MLAVRAAVATVRAAVGRALAEVQVDVEGVVLEAFEALLRFPTIVTIDNREAWLCTVARCLVGRVRRRARRAAAGQPIDHIDPQRRLTVRDLAGRTPTRSGRTRRQCAT